MPTEHRPKLTYDAPIGSVDLAAHDDDGNPYEIRSCSHCLPWYAEVIIDDEGAVFEREWHAIECPNFAELTIAGQFELQVKREPWPPSLSCLP